MINLNNAFFTLKKLNIRAKSGFNNSRSLVESIGYPGPTPTRTTNLDKIDSICEA
ncbi:hypothetical protein OAC89_03445 [Deltaproteobacteria bacterium]|nr:hypothetical protein [Deltaproteobacteria bacterium]